MPTAAIDVTATVSDLDSIRSLPTPDLRRELADALGVTARHLLRLAAVWQELERRGEDLSDLRSGLVVYLPLIATGSVLPEVVVRFAGNQTLLRAVSQLPADQQRRIVDGEPVPLAVRSGDGYTHRMLPAHALTNSQVRQVFGERVIRTEAQQIAILTAARQPPPARTPRRGNARADRRSGVVMVGHRAVLPTDLLLALADLKGANEDPPAADAPSVSARLTPAEHETIRQRAAAANVPIATVVRNALKATGMI